MRTTDTYDLEEALTEATEEQRKEYFRLWGLTGESYRNFEEYLTSVMESLQEPICARFVWEYITPDERQILYHSMSYSARDGLRRDALQKKSQLPPERFDPAADSLVNRLLLYQRTEKLDAGQRGHSSHLPRDLSASKERKAVPVLYPFDDYLTTLYTIGREIFTPLGDRSKKSFAELTANLDIETLYEIYQSYEVKWGKYYSRSDFGEMIAKALYQLDEPLDHLSGFEGDARDLYVWLRQQGGQVSMKEVRTHTSLDDNSLARVLYELESTALAFDTLTREGRVLFIPHDIFGKLRHIESNIADTVIELPGPAVSEDFVPAAIRHSEMPILYDMAYVINAIHQQTIEPTQVGRVPKRIATKLRAQLHGQVRPDYQYDDNYLEMLLHIAKENGLVRLSKSPLPEIKDHYEAGDRLSWWSDLSIAGQTAYLLHSWKSSFRWDDLEGTHYRAWDPYAWKPMAGREILLKHLARRTPGRWYTVVSLLQEIWDEDPFTMHPQSPYTRKTGHSKTRETREKWERGDGETYIGMLASTLYELGIVDLGYDRSNALETQQQLNPTAFMLTEAGAAILPLIGENPPQADESARTLIVQPSFELLVLQPDMPTLYSLLPFTQIVQASMVSRLTLNRTTLLRALEGGKNIEQILHILEEHSQKELPQNVVYSLNDWARSHKGATLSHVLLIEVSSEAVANQLNSSSKLKGLGLRQLGPFIFALNHESNLKQVKQVLEQEGISVQISGNIFVAPKRSTTIYGMHL
ncbi:MAG: helicase-associated domain-containing protein [Ktedonobacteraceae bacterium]|nr:helicase-associated domain-containing protein [Ktedonobacteraceae bacterium]